jgi:hypothetical protein
MRVSKPSLRYFVPQVDILMAKKRSKKKRDEAAPEVEADEANESLISVNAESEQADLPSWLSAMERAFQAFERAIELADDEKLPSDELPISGPDDDQTADDGQDIKPVEQALSEEDAPPPIPSANEDPRAFSFTLTASSRDLKNLQEDIQRLFRFGDITGALLSLERMVLLANGDPEVNSFLERNHDQLISVFERVFDGFHQKVEPTKNVIALGPDFREHPTVQSVWSAVGASSDLKTVLDSVDINDIATAAVLHHLLRCRRLQFFD